MKGKVEQEQDAPAKEYGGKKDEIIKRAAVLGLARFLIVKLSEHACRCAHENGNY